MKKTAILLFALFCTSFAFAQCNSFYVIDEGTAWTYENYNPKGKPSGKNEQKVTAFDKTATGYKATVASTLWNEKGKKVTEGELELICDNGTFIMDMRKFIPEEQQKAFSSYEMKIESENLELPSKLSVGQTLKNGSVTLSAVGSPVPMKITVNITDRKVEAKESITTPAGTFDCYKISSKSNTQMQMGINMSLNFSGTEWIAEKVGMVKSESYDKNGKLAGYTLLVNRK
ncbi:MAG: hypothetical protein QY309_00185 [Cyclobacteriaceae bacterium]|nr:MAG: hypothetical protein QY309_00185 [Cyclobacteriaceae bacterium]